MALLRFIDPRKFWFPLDNKAPGPPLIYLVELLAISDPHINICVGFVFTIFYTGSFQAPPKKNHPHLKCQFPPKIPIWPKSLLYECSEKWLRTPPRSSPMAQEGGLQTMTYIWHLFCLFLFSQENHLDSQIIPYPKKKFRLMSLTKCDSLFPSEKN